MARRKAPKRRRPKSFGILNFLESATYLGIILRGTTGSGIMEFVTGEGDLIQAPSTFYKDDALGVTSEVEGAWAGTSTISLKDLMMSPTEGLNQLVSNFSSNIVPMAVAGATTAITFNVGRRLLRRPVNNINRNIMKPLLGAGIRL
jgi:hypothetical protein